MSQASDDQNTENQGVIIPPNLAVKAMRDSGYKNTAYALAELIDNSVQAEAKNIEVICIEGDRKINTRISRRIQHIGILDNGTGMPPEILRRALQFGNGTHLNDRQGIGRFGMGLPNSSISQCRRVDVWTWENGPDNAMHSFLDVDDIEKGQQLLVPEPEHDPVPKDWRSRSSIVGTSGTLVVWSKFEDHRLSWHGAPTTLLHTEKLVGRMYRKFIDSRRLDIRLLAFLETDDSNTFDMFVRVNDPLFLMRNSSTSPPFADEPMFQSWGEDEVFPIDYNGEIHEVVVRMSYARNETVPKDRSDRGRQPYGKDAGKNLGLSIVRQDRELILDPAWVQGFDPVERWWGAEVLFPATLDEVFGVTNTKQGATNFSDLAQFDWQADAEEGEHLLSDYVQRLQDESNPRALLIPIVEHIEKQLREIRKLLKKQTVGSRPKNKRHDDHAASDTATAKFKKRADEGHETEADKEKFTKSARDSFESDLTKDKQYHPDVAREIANATFKHKRKVEFVAKAMEGYAFFNVEYQQGGLTVIVFNSNHPFYEKFDKFLDSLDPELDDLSTDELKDRIYTAAFAFKLLFTAWARYEMEEVKQQQKEQLSDMRQEWGKMARFFLAEDDE